MNPLDVLLKEAEAAVRQEREKLIATGTDPALLDKIEAELAEIAEREPTPEERASFAALMKRLDAH